MRGERGRGCPARREARRFAVAKIKRCRQCGVPLRISGEFTWHDNGIITQNRSQGERVLFYESDFLDELFRYLQARLGAPVEDMAIEGKRRSAREYVHRNIIPVMSKALYRYRPKVLNERFIALGACFGYGRISAIETRNRGDDLDYQVVSVRHPYSLPLFCGDLLGIKEALDGRDFSISVEETGEHEYRLTMRPGEHRARLVDDGQRALGAPKAGELKHKRCAACGIPLGVARCRWDLDTGVIVDPGTSRRMAIFYPGSIEAVLQDLLEEMGEGIVDMIIDEQRRFVRKTIGRDAALTRRQSYPEMGALRGLGNATRIEAGDRHCTVIMENPCLPLFMVGISQAFYEMETGHDEVERAWEILPDGDLVVELRV